MSDYQSIITGQWDNIAKISFNRPQSLNSLSGELIEESRDFIARLTVEHSTRVLVITGEGRGFCSGAHLGSDMPLEGSAGSLGESMRNSGNELIKAIYHAPFPVIASVNGAAAGAGVGIALAADFILAARSARFILAFANIGMGLDFGTSWFLPRLIGPKRAAMLGMLAEPLDAQTAYDWGILYKVCDDEQLQNQTDLLARRLAAGATLGLAAQKDQLRRAAVTSLTKSLDFEADTQDRLIKSADLTEGVSAFREKRPPHFTGT